MSDYRETAREIEALLFAAAGPLSEDDLGKRLPEGADVMGALPAALRQLGCDARVAIPGYRSAIAAAQQFGVSWFEQPMIIESGGVDHRIHVGTTVVEGLPVHLLAASELYDREGIYGPSPSNDYDDNARRYSVFAKACLALPGAKIGARFIEGLDAFVTTMRINDINQVVYVDATTGAYQQLTHDLVNRNGPFMWFAPDVGEHGEYVFMAMMNTTKIGIWRQDANGAWYLYYKFNIPSAKEYVSSPEPFVYNGKSYIITVAALQLGEVGNFPYQPIGQTEIWIAGIDPNNPFFRRVDDSRGGHHRVGQPLVDQHPL